MWSSYPTNKHLGAWKMKQSANFNKFFHFFIQIGSSFRITVIYLGFILRYGKYSTKNDWVFFTIVLFSFRTLPVKSFRSITTTESALSFALFANCEQVKKDTKEINCRHHKLSFLCTAEMNSV